jgi:hypothetical protein
LSTYPGSRVAKSHSRLAPPEITVGKDDQEDASEAPRFTADHGIPPVNGSVNG